MNPKYTETFVRCGLIGLFFPFCVLNDSMMQLSHRHSKTTTPPSCPRAYRVYPRLMACSRMNPFEDGAKCCVSIRDTTSRSR